MAHVAMRRGRGEAKRTFASQRPIKSQNATKILIRIEGHGQRTRAERSIIRIAQEQKLGLSIRSIVHLRKRIKPLITLLSGPHVHKKSRDQYKIEKRSMIVALVVDDERG